MIKRFFYTGIILCGFLCTAKSVLAAELRFSGPDKASVGDVFQINVEVSQAQDVDTIRLKSLYPANILQLVSVVPSGAFENASPGNELREGAFSFGVFTLKGGFTGKTNAAQLTFRARSVGTAQVIIQPDSRILSAGKDQATGFQAKTIVIGSTNIQPEPSATSTTSFGVILSSPTNPSQDAWYHTNTVQIAWGVFGKQASGVLLGFDQLPHGPATTQNKNLQGSMAFAPPLDGIWFAHVKVLFTDGTSLQRDFTFKIDREKPLAVTPYFDSTIQNGMLSPVLGFGSVDKSSGVQSYDVIIDGSISNTTSSQISLAGLAPGPHHVSVQAIDFAGNVSMLGSIDFILPAIRVVGAASLHALRAFNTLFWLWVTLIVLGLEYYLVTSQRFAFFDNPHIIHRSKKKRSVISRGF